MTTPSSGRRTSANERGIALVLSLFLMMAMSIVAASLMFLSQTETYSSMNYRLMSQARYGAESGIQQAANFLMFTSSYTPPSTGGADSIANYNTTVSPVTYNGNPVTLAPTASQSNYPVSTVKTAYATAVGTSLAAGSTTITYAPTATLLSMEEVPASQSLNGVEFTIQTWQITSDGTISAGSRNATVEVTAIVDTQKIGTNSPAFNYAAFATAATCGAITMSGGAATKSYDSSTYSGSGSVTAGNGGLQSASGNVGTNGNLTDSGGATINGTLSTPRVGVGSCSSGNVDANTSSGGATITGGLVQLPSALTPANPVVAVPTIPATSSGFTITNLSTCVSIVTYVPAANCHQNSVGNLTISAGAGTLALTNVTVTTGALSFTNGSYTMGAVSVASSGSLALGDGSATANSMSMNSFSASNGGSVTIEGGTYAMNSYSMSGGTAATLTGGQVNLTVVNSFALSNGATVTLASGASNKMQLNIVSTASGTPLDLSGGTLANQSMDASRFLVEYGGTGTIKLSNGTQQAAVIYAPNAPVSFSGGAAFYGEVIASTISDSNGATIYYDRHLASSGLFSSTLYQSGNPLMSAFSWKKQ